MEQLLKQRQNAIDKEHELKNRHLKVSLRILGSISIILVLGKQERNWPFQPPYTELLFSLLLQLEQQQAQFVAVRKVDFLKAVELNLKKKNG